MPKHWLRDQYWAIDNLDSAQKKNKRFVIMLETDIGLKTSELSTAPFWRYISKNVSSDNLFMYIKGAGMRLERSTTYFIRLKGLTGFCHYN